MPSVGHLRPEATPETQKDLIEANAAYRVGDPAAFATATNMVNAHVSAHPDLMNIPGTERAAKSAPGRQWQ